MKKNAFTLIELLAVIIILGVIMSIAIPNVVATLDRNKKETYLQDAQRMIAAAEYKIRSDVRMEFPDNNNIVVIPLDKLNSSEVVTSPYDTPYSKSKSFVAIVKETDEYIYYAHLISCTDLECANVNENTVGQNRGINLSNVEDMKGTDRFDLVVKGSEVNTSSILSFQSFLMETLARSNVVIY